MIVDGYVGNNTSTQRGRCGEVLDIPQRQVPILEVEFRCLVECISYHTMPFGRQSVFGLSNGTNVFYSLNKLALAIAELQSLFDRINLYPKICENK